MVCACLFVALPSSAAANWSAPVIVSGAGTSTSQTEVAGNSNGDSVVVWKRSIGGFDRIQATRVSIDGTQGPILTLSPAAMDSSNPVVAVREDGSAMVGWINGSGASDFVQTASIAADGTAGPPVNRSNTLPAANNAKDVAVSLGADGTAGVVWRRFNGTDWYAETVRVAADGTSGTIHALTDGSVSTGPPSVAAIPPVNAGGPNNYRIFWPQGSSTNSNVGTRDLFSDDTVTDLVLVFASGSECQDPFDTYVTYGAEGSMNAFWVCYRESMDLDTGILFSNWSVQWLRLNKGLPVTSPAIVNNASPTVLGDPYPISALYATGTPGGQPALAWTHDLSGSQRIETWRVLNNGLGQGWANTTTQATTVEEPTIAANASAAAVAGGVDPGLIPGQPAASWVRFSNNAYEPFVPTGSFLYSDDPGFVVAASGRSLAAFTAIDGLNVGTSRIMTYTKPGLRVDPDVQYFGRNDIGESVTRSITIQSTGQTSATVTGISLSGANADRYQLDGASDCLRSILPAAICRFEVTFTPSSTTTQTAKVTVTSDAGNEDVNLTGDGENRTRNQLSATPRNTGARKGHNVNIRVTARNVGAVASTSTRICVNMQRRVLRLSGNRCRNLGSFPAGASRTLNYRIRVTGRARSGVRIPVSFVLRSGNAVVRKSVVGVRRKGR